MAILPPPTEVPERLTNRYNNRIARLLNCGVLHEVLQPDNLTVPTRRGGRLD
jgi:hypothetical protein